MNNQKVVIITGASSGIGFSIAQALDKKYRLILISKTESKLIKTYKKLKSDNLFYAFDISNNEDVESTYISLNKEIHEIYALINCSGFLGAIGKLATVSPEEFMTGVNVNLYGSYLMCYNTLKSYESRGLKKIINFSGGGATGPFPRYSSYSCSKIALVKLTENMALEYPDIDINIIAPGFIKTDLAQQTLDAGRDKAGTFYDKTMDILNEGGQSISRVIDLIQFLLSEKSHKISGKLISAQWDNWEDVNFQKRLRNEKDLCTLRRIDDRYFTAIPERE